MSQPFSGDILPTRVPLFASGRPCLPFPHPWNYQKPIDILATFFHGADDESGPGRHNRYLKLPGLDPILVSRDPELIRAITLNTGDREGQFDRDTMPSEGIARATGKDTLLYANGEVWKRQKKLSSAPFRKTTLFQPEQFLEFEETFRHTVTERLEAFHYRVSEEGAPLNVVLEPEIKAVMLELLTNNFFGAQISRDDIWEVYVPALEKVITNIVRDTVINKTGLPLWKWLGITPGIREAKRAIAHFERLTDLALATRSEGKGLWQEFKSDVPDSALRSNIKVFLAGAMEATTSFASWTVCHLARNPEAQERVFQEVQNIEDYTPEKLKSAQYLDDVLNETLRLTPSLYFLPRRATVDTEVTTQDKRKINIPKGTHILLDVWHANRHEDHWGVNVSGYPAAEFRPERFEHMREKGIKEPPHFGFGNGPRICPGKNLGHMEVALAVGAFVKLFTFKAMNKEFPEVAGVSTKPADGVEVILDLR